MRPLLFSAHANFIWTGTCVAPASRDTRPTTAAAASAKITNVALVIRMTPITLPFTRVATGRPVAASPACLHPQVDPQYSRVTRYFQEYRIVSLAGNCVFVTPDSVAARGRPEVDVGFGGVAIDLLQLLGAEVETLERSEVLLQLRDARGADERRRHPRVAQRPRERHLPQALAAPRRDLVQRPDLRQRLLGQKARRERAVTARPPPLRAPIEVLARQHPLRERREADAGTARS